VAGGTKESVMTMWGDAIKHARDVMKTALRGVARAASTKLTKNLARTATDGVVRASSLTTA